MMTTNSFLINQNYNAIIIAIIVLIIATSASICVVFLSKLIVVINLAQSVIEFGNWLFIELIH